MLLLRNLDHIPGAIYKCCCPFKAEPQLLYASTRAASCTGRSRWFRT